MEYCYKCRASEVRAILFEVVLPDGISKVCNKCSADESHPVIKNTFTSPEEFEKKQSVYERLKKISGVEERNFNPKIDLGADPKKEEDVSLRELVEKNYKNSVGTQGIENENLIPNFHWIVMRARRMKHLTPAQLAREIREPEIAIKTLERGIPPTNMNIIDKLESFLNVRLKKSSEIKKPEFKEEVDIEKIRNLTISDLKEIKDEKEFGVSDDEFFELEEDFEDDEFMGR